MRINQRLVVSAVCLSLSLLAGCSESSFSGNSSNRKDAKVEPEKPQTDDAKPAQVKAPAPALGTSTPTKDIAPTDKIDGTDSSGAAASTPSPAPAPFDTTVPQGAVTKGSFTVWAEPANPASFQDYQIFIKVDLPSNTTQYAQGDISGILRGTDGYDQSLSESIKTHSHQPETPAFNFGGQTAQISLWVPGSFSKVQDTVEVSSALLGESQNITIVFQ